MPYKERENFKLPNPRSGPLWRYMDFQKFVALVDSSALFFPSIERLCQSDPYEGSYSDLWRLLLAVPYSLLNQPIRDAIGMNSEDEWRRYVKSNKVGADYVKARHKNIFASSWHFQPHESLAMWSLYGKSGDGIAVVSSTTRLIRALADVPYEVSIGKVKYVDYDSEMLGVLGDMLRPSLHKRLGFEHEKEVRALILDESPSPSSEAGGLAVKVELKKLVDCIMIAPTAPPWVLPLVESLVAKYGYSFRVYQSRLLTPPSDINLDFLDEIVKGK